jgi:transcription elongation factor Elf1
MVVNQTSENQTTIENVTTLLKKQDHTGRYSCKMCGKPIDAHCLEDVQKFCSVYNAGDLTG